MGDGNCPRKKERGQQHITLTGCHTEDSIGLWLHPQAVQSAYPEWQLALPARFRGGVLFSEPFRVRPGPMTGGHWSDRPEQQIHHRRNPAPFDLREEMPCRASSRRL
jgi:hypothetical protein